jgi:MoxR-like ATPase
MTLPGKLCIGILEEDNPQKSYFRFKPLLIANGEVFEKCDVTDEFPENGCIRIVPDKNESSRFKARMRRMGGFCVVDLREHPDENDKIRPNKNYRGDEAEANAYIIYSDVVREPGEGQIVEILEQDAPDDALNIALTCRQPRTSRVLMRAGGEVADHLWIHAPIAEIEGGVAFTRTELRVDTASAQRFDFPDFDEEDLSFLISAPGAELFASVPAPVARPPLQYAEERAAEAETHAEIAPEIEPQAEKPWITRDTRVIARPVDLSLSPFEQTIALQTGINPRRGRSLKEVIEDKWRRSRIDQLGHPVPGSVMGQPVISPVDRAVDAVREAWDHLDARYCLARALAGVDGLVKAIVSGEDVREAEERAARLSEYEEARASLGEEIERLKRERDDVKNEIVREMRAQNEAEIDAYAARVRELEAREADLRARAEEAKNVAEAAERAVSELTNEKLQARLSEFAINARALDLIALAREGAPAVLAPARTFKRAEAMGLRELVARVRARFAAAGFSLTDDEIINLIALFVLPGDLVISGPTGSGKTAYARLLAEVLGLAASGRFQDFRAGDVISDADADGLPAAIFFDDINSDPDTCRMAVEYRCAPSGRKAVMTVRDSAEGCPLPARLLDRAFFLRLGAERLNTPWARAGHACAADDVVLTRDALNALFVPDERGVSQPVTRRMRALRDELAKYGMLLSRRTLDGIWLYCAAVAPHLSMTPLEAFDLAFAQRALPAILSMAGVDLLHAIPAIFEGMPRSLELLKQPLAIEV